jgi:replicative DNA helicase
MTTALAPVKKVKKAKPKYDFPVEFQSNVARLVLNDPGFLLGYRRALDPAYFTDPNLSWIVESALKVFDRSKGHPTPGSVLTCIRKGTPEGLDPDEAESRARRLYKKGVPEDATFVREEVVTFGRHQRLKAIIGESGGYLEGGQFDQFVLDVQEANVLSADAASPFYDYEALTADRIDRYEEGLKNCRATGTAIDKHLQGGGLGPGEMGILMGLPGFHKTTFLCNFGMAARDAGLSVFHCTFEVSSVKTARRYDCRIANMSLNQMLLNRAKAKRKIETFNERKPGRLIIHWWPGRACTMSDLQQYLRWLAAHKGFKPDLIVADYVSKMKPSQSYDSKMSRLGLEELYGDFRSLCGELGIPGWTAIQANRAGFAAMKDEDAVLTEENAAEAFAPIRDADLVVTLNQTREERANGEMRLYGAKVRDEASQWIERVRINPERYTVSSIESEPDGGDLEDHPANNPPPPHRKG